MKPRQFASQIETNEKKRKEKAVKKFELDTNCFKIKGIIIVLLLYWTQDEPIMFFSCIIENMYIKTHSSKPPA